MNSEKIFDKALSRLPLTFDEAMWLYSDIPVSTLFRLADTIRRNAVDDPNVVTWQIDRNVNITNVCISGCKFCNFHCRIGSPDAYITTLEEYIPKIEQTIRLAGHQLLPARLGVDEAKSHNGIAWVNPQYPHSVLTPLPWKFTRTIVS